MRRTRRRLPALAAGTLAAALVLVGCSGSSDDDAETTGTESPAASDPNEPDPADVAALEAVEVDGEPGSEPTLAFDTPFEISTVVAVLDTPGSGEDLVEGEELVLDYVAVNGDDGSVLDSSWERGATDRILFGEASMAPPLYQVLEGQKIGTRLLFAVPGAEAQEATETTPEQQETPATIMAIEVVDKAPARATGTAVEPPAGLPEVTLADDGAPSVAIPDGDPPAELVAQTLIEGTGEPVEAGQSVRVHYSGWVWADGSMFDSSWEKGQPFNATLASGSLIDGWVEGLAGKPVGSQVLLVIPPEKGYQDQERPGIPPSSTLVFVVDILAAM